MRDVEQERAGVLLLFLLAGKIAKLILGWRALMPKRERTQHPRRIREKED